MNENHSTQAGKEVYQVQATDTSPSTCSATAPSPANPDEEIVDSAGKNGLVTAIGVILAFTLTFFGTWSLTEDPHPTSPTFGDSGWEYKDLPTVILLGIGIVLLIVTLYHALIPYRYNAKHFRQTVWLFTFSIGVVLVGFLTAVFIS